jgi:acyl-CoA synthetase (AMP-forming)/AMP-acid ligase II
VNLYSRLAYLGRYQPAKVAVETPKEEVTYAALDETARRIAALLRVVGVAPGDVVGLRLRDTPQHMAALFAVMRVGGVVLPLDWRGTRDELARIAAQFQPKAILADDQSALAWLPAMVDIGRAAALEPDTVPADDAPGNVFGLTLTSGTTGQPKAMIATHDQTYARCMTRALEGMFQSTDRYMTTLPLAYHAGREHALSAIVIGATLVMFPTMFSPRELVDFVNAHDISVFNLSPNMSRALLGIAGAAGDLLMPNVRTMISTTGKLDPHERVLLRQHLVPRLIDYYGNSGAGPIAVMSRDEDATEYTAAGRVAIGVEVAIVDDDGRPLADGEVGSIRLRGRTITTDMAGAEEVRGEGLRDGWYYPGDLGKFDGRGILHLMGRNADLIKRGGLMVHAQEVERAIREHPDVIDVAVVGLASKDLGQEVVAFMEVRNPVDPKEITRQLRGKLAAYKVPTRFETIDALPRNPAGKVVKGKLTG